MSIAFEQVSFSYTPLTKRQKKAGEVQRYALRNVSFTLNDGEFLAIAGHTGSGKSTLVQHLNGLANPTEGRVLWNGKDLADRKNANCARGDIGMVFQYPEHQLFAETVYEDVAFGPRNMGLPEDEVDARIREALADVHLDFDTLSERSPFELSGGQQRRVAFAGVLAMRPTTLVLDEPVAGTAQPYGGNGFAQHERHRPSCRSHAGHARRRSGVCRHTGGDFHQACCRIARNWPRHPPCPNPGKPASRRRHALTRKALSS